MQTTKTILAHTHTLSLSISLQRAMAIIHTQNAYIKHVRYNYPIEIPTFVLRNWHSISHSINYGFMFELFIQVNGHFIICLFFLIGNVMNFGFQSDNGYKMNGHERRESERWKECEQMKM